MLHILYRLINTLIMNTELKNVHFMVYHSLFFKLTEALNTLQQRTADLTSFHQLTRPWLLIRLHWACPEICPCRQPLLAMVAVEQWVKQKVGWLCRVSWTTYPICIYQHPRVPRRTMMTMAMSPPMVESQTFLKVPSFTLLKLEIRHHLRNMRRRLLKTKILVAVKLLWVNLM